jgi:hypothetical protein
MRTVALSALLLAAACGPAPTRPAVTQPAVEPLSSFELSDVNPGSRTAGQQVGPLAFRGKVSGWYFTHTS